MGEIRVPPGGGVPLHVHPGPEPFRVLEARFAFLRGAAEASPPGRPSAEALARVTALAAAHRVTLLGPS